MNLLGRLRLALRRSFRSATGDKSDCDQDQAGHEVQGGGKQGELKKDDHPGDRRKDERFAGLDEIRHRRKPG